MHYLLPSRTNQLVATDFAGPFKTTTRGNRYVIIITDCFGKTLRCTPLPSKATALAVTTIVEQWCCIYGVPEQILSDKGKEYRSRIWDAVCDLLDIERLTTTPGHPQCDGQSEKNVQQIKKMIRAHCSADQSDWDIGIAQLVFAYNASVHDTIGISPFEVMFGRQPRIPIDLAFPNTLDMTRPPILTTRTVQVDDVRSELSAVVDGVAFFEQLEDVPAAAIAALQPTHVQSYVNELQQRLKTSFALLEHNKISRMERAKLHHDRHIRKRTYEVGEWVLCNHPKLKNGLSRGLAPRYHGPFIIVGKYANGCDYLIRHAHRSRGRVKQIHQDNLRVYFRRGHPDDGQEDNDEVEDIGNATQPAQIRRPYTKNLSNPRWQRRAAQAEGADAADGDDSSESSAEEEQAQGEASAPVADNVSQQLAAAAAALEPAKPTRPVGRPRKVVNAPEASTTSAAHEFQGGEADALAEPSRKPSQRAKRKSARISAQRKA